VIDLVPVIFVVRETADDTVFDVLADAVVRLVTAIFARVGFGWYGV
jgi:hypothetical protein